VLLLLAQKSKRPTTERHKLAKGRFARLRGKLFFITFFEESAANGLKTPRSLRGETHSAGAARPQTLPHATKLLQLCRENVRKVQEEKKTLFGVQAFLACAFAIAT